MLVINLGYRTYEIAEQDETKARELWAHTISQDDFEDAMEDEGIDFWYDLSQD